MITLTMDDGSSRPIDINPAAISAITAEFQMGDTRIGATVHIHGTCFSVIETRAEILALLAEPVAVTVTEAMHVAALDRAVTLGWNISPKVSSDLQLILKAALAVRAP